MAIPIEPVPYSFQCSSFTDGNLPSTMHPETWPSGDHAHETTAIITTRKITRRSQEPEQLLISHTCNRGKYCHAPTCMYAYASNKAPTPTLRDRDSRGDGLASDYKEDK